MPNDERIVSYTAEEIEDMRRRGETRMDWAKIDATTEAEIEAQAKEDGTDGDWFATARRVQPFPLKETKRQVTLRLDQDVLEHFKQGGRGWQSRINAVLRSFVEADRKFEAGRNQP